MRILIFLLLCSVQCMGQIQHDRFSFNNVPQDIQPVINAQLDEFDAVKYAPVSTVLGLLASGIGGYIAATAEEEAFQVMGSVIAIGGTFTFTLGSYRWSRKNSASRQLKYYQTVY